MTQHETKDVLALCAECETNAEFLSSLAHEIGNHTVESDTRQHQRHRRKHVEQDHDRASISKRVGDRLGQRLGFGNHVLRIVAVNRLTNGSERNFCALIDANQHAQLLPAASDLFERFVELRLK